MVFIALLYGIQASLSGNAQSPSMPREDVVDIPAVGDGLWVSNLFQSNMVLQRDQPISIWGWAEPGTQVQVVLQDTKMSTRVNQDRVWRVKLPARPASAEPLTIEISAAEHKVLLKNVLIGDVWVLGGQLRGNTSLNYPRGQWPRTEIRFCETA